LSFSKAKTEGNHAPLIANPVQGAGQSRSSEPEGKANKVRVARRRDTSQLFAIDDYLSWAGAELGVDRLFSVRRF
jgi:hypothetical protein